MKERLLTLGLAVGALLLFYALFVPKPAAESAVAARPLSTETGAVGYQGLWLWLAQEHIGTIALHERFDKLPSGKVDGIGNILFTTLPHKLPVRPAEAEQLDAWIERGNTLLVAAALDDTPEWTVGDGSVLKAVGRLTRLNFEVIDPEKGADKRGLGEAFAALANAKVITVEPRGGHPLMDGVQSIKVTSDLPASRWRAKPMDAAGVLEIAQVAGSGDGAIWLRRQGSGQVIVVAVAGLFSNRALENSDNAKLFANIVSRRLGAGGRVIFDDVHQGAVGYYDAKAFFGDPRLHRTLAWLIASWFVFVLGLQNLRDAAQRSRAIDVTTFLGTSSEFLAATLTPATAGERLLSNFFNSVRARLGLPENGAPLWDWLASQAYVSPEEVAELQLFNHRVHRGGSFDLIGLQNLLVRLQGKII